VDFTHTKGYSVILDKATKGYQSDNRFLIIPIYGEVSASELSELNNKLTMRGVRNVKVVSISEFCSLFSINPASLTNILQQIEDSYTNDDVFDNLIKESGNSFITLGATNVDNSHYLLFQGLISELLS